MGMTKILPLGYKTKQWGEVSMVGRTGGERYYWMVDKTEGLAPLVSMIPAFIIEAREREDE